MILKNKNAIIYGGGGSMGGAVAKAFAAAGAKVFLTGRNKASVRKVADEILSLGGSVETAQVDALNETEIESHIDAVTQSGEKVDISFNAVGIDVVQNLPLIEISLDDYIRPITLTMETRFLTARAAGKVMKKQGYGTIISLTATPGGIGYPFTAGFAAACCAVESLSTNLATELGVYGVRVVNIRSGGSPDSKVFKDAIDNNPEGMKRILQNMKEDTMLKTLPLMSDIANTAVFLASDFSSKITGVTIDVTCGTTAALNYRIPSEGSKVATFSERKK